MPRNRIMACVSPDEIQHAKENECDQQNVNDTEPVKALKNEEDVDQIDRP